MKRLYIETLSQFCVFHADVVEDNGTHLLVRPVRVAYELGGNTAIDSFVAQFAAAAVHSPDGNVRINCLPDRQDGSRVTISLMLGIFAYGAELNDPRHEPGYAVCALTDEEG